MQPTLILCLDVPQLLREIIAHTAGDRVELLAANAPLDLAERIEAICPDVVLVDTTSVLADEVRALLIARSRPAVVLASEDARAAERWSLSLCQEWLPLSDPDRLVDAITSTNPRPDP